MKRYDLRHLKDDFYGRMQELIEQGLKVGEVGIFLFEVGDFSHIQKSADFVRELGHDLMNSLKFNEVDWTIVVKKVDDATRQSRTEAVEKARLEAEAKAKEAEKLAQEKAEAEAKLKAKAEEEAKIEAQKAEAEAKAKAEEEAKRAEEEAKAKEAEEKAKVEAKAKSEKSVEKPVKKASTKKAKKSKAK
jgi:NADH-quinone oxidoreductase subunit E